jgi:hypothetical protein
MVVSQTLDHLLERSVFLLGCTIFLNTVFVFVNSVEVIVFHLYKFNSVFEVS